MSPDRDDPGGTDAAAPADEIDALLDPGLRHALAALGHAHGDRGPVEVHDLKSRPSRRDSRFIGRCARTALGMTVRWGVVVKRTSPRSAAELRVAYEALARALDFGDDLPEAPPIVAARPHDGWIALQAWPGAMMSRDPDATRRACRVARVAQLLAALERSRRAASLWPGRRWTAIEETRRLDEVWARAHEQPPAWARALMERLARSRSGVVPAHRDLNAEQVIVDPNAADAEEDAYHWIDWDLAALAPPGLDLGNLLAHERLAALAGHGARGIAFASLRWEALASYFDAGGRATLAELVAWEAAACLRLAGLSLQRARGDDGITRNPEWLPPPSAQQSEAEHLLRAGEGVFAAAESSG